MGAESQSTCPAIVAPGTASGRASSIPALPARTSARFPRPAARAMIAVWTSLAPEEFAVPARILDGKALAQRVRQDVAAEVARLKAEQGITPGLVVVLVGDNPASQVYVRNKQNACKAAGMNGTVERLPADTTVAGLIATIDRLNADPTVHGILVQLPLPAQIEERAILEQIDPIKDVDGFHPVNVGLLTIGLPRFVPCTPLGIREMLVHAGVETRGAHAVILGRSQIVGKPMALLLVQKGIGGGGPGPRRPPPARGAPPPTRPGRHPGAPRRPG